MRAVSTAARARPSQELASGDGYCLRCACRAAWARPLWKARHGEFQLSRTSFISKSPLSCLANRQGGRHRFRLSAQLGPIDQPQLTIHVLDERRATLHPIAVIAIQYAVDVAHLGPVDVAANHGIDSALARRLR